jgi:Outer membrane protein beta-barrel domain
LQSNLKNEKVKKYFFLVAALLSATLLKAQDVRFGLKAGVNLSTIKFNALNVVSAGIPVVEESPSNSFYTGFHVGGFAQVAVFYRFAFQPEVHYSVQGSKLEGNVSNSKTATTVVEVLPFVIDLGGGPIFIPGTPGVDVTTANETKTKTTIKTSYINAPLLVKFFPTKKLFFNAGPQLGFLLSAKKTDEASTTTTLTTRTYTTASGTLSNVASPSTVIAVEPVTTDIKDSFKSINFGLVIGGGYYITDNIFAEARYHIGLSNDAEEIENATVQPNAKSSSLQFSVGYRF